MPDLDSTAIAAVEGEAFSPVWLIYLDLADGALRVTNYGQPITVSGSGDSELDGNYTAWGGQFLEIGDINNTDGGSDTRVHRLSGIVTIDTDLLNDIGDRAKWQGRPCRIWCRVYDETGATPQGAIAPWDTGYMSSVRILAAPEGQEILLSVENWRAAFNNPSNRTYLGQKDYDSADTSAQATIAAANGLRRDSGASGGVGPGLGTGGTGGGGIGSGGLGAMDGGGINGTGSYGGAYGDMGAGGLTVGAINLS